MVSINSLYSQPIYSGGGIPFFAGSRRQFGGGIFGSIARLVMPAVKNFILPTASSALKSIGRSALNIGTNVAMDALHGRNIKDALIDHTKQEAVTQLENHLAAPAPAPPTRKRKSATTASTASAVKQRRVGTTTTSSSSSSSRSKKKKKRNYF